MNMIHLLVTDVGEFPMPPEFVEARKHVKWRKNDRGWPDMRFKNGKQWARMFKAFSDEKMKEYLARG